MKTISKFLVITLSISLIYLSCSEKRDPFSVTSHPEGWSKTESSKFHGLYVLENNANMDNCKTCHGLDYTGGSAGASCSESGCHMLPDGPEACNTCHGNMDNDAPPKDLAGNQNTSSIGVGAHQAHLDSEIFSPNCSSCHIYPTDFSSPGHIDNYPFHSEVNFSSFATNSGLLNTEWSRESETCSNTYCHGAFEFKRSDPGAFTWAYNDSSMSGNNQTVKWTSVGSNQAICGSCHGLPPKGHIGAANCAPCHPRVVDANNNIIDKSLHINGQKEVF